MKERKNFSAIGKNIPKIDAIDKVTGKANYIQDLIIPRMLYGKILYSKYPHARIIKINVEKAKKLNGVVSIITGEDIPEIKMGFYKDNPPIKSNKVCSLRDEVAAVAAISLEIALEAINLIEVIYEELSPIFDPEEALLETAPLVHEEHKTNLLKMPWKLHYGNVDIARRESAYIVNKRFTTTWVTHCCLSTSGALAEFDNNNNLILYTNTQIPSLAQKDFMVTLKLLGLSNSRVRIIKPTIGGGFGSKLDTYAYEQIAILLAWHTHRPVKILFDRKEEFLATSTRQPAIIDIALGCNKKGNFLFRDVSMILDNGAYTSWGATTPSVMMMPITSLYRVPNIRYEAKCVYTNNTYSQAFRGYGNPQATFAIESAIDMLAEAAGINRIAIRKINCNQSNDITPMKLHITSCGLPECIDAVTKELEVERPKLEGEGIGIASLIHVGGGARIYKSDGCGTTIIIDDYGKVNVMTGATDMGQGADTVIAQIVAEELEINIENINVIHSDTDICPWDVGAHASRTTFVAGNSAIGAAQKVKKELIKFASVVLEEKIDSLILKRGIITTKNMEKHISINKLIRQFHFRNAGKMIVTNYFYDPPNENMDRDFTGNMSVTYAFGTHGVRVKVDKETGKIKILNYVAAHDVGRAINPILVKGQIYGAVMMGIGYTLTEEVLIKNGKNLNSNFRDYKILTTKDIVPIKPIIVETNDPYGPYGAKGVGEPGCVPSAPAIANAIYDAIGVRITDLPITPERVLAAIKNKTI